jgi:hypothetical protein
LVLHPQLPPEPQEDFATGADSAAGVVEQDPVLHPPEVDVFVLQQPIVENPYRLTRFQARQKMSEKSFGMAESQDVPRDSATPIRVPVGQSALNHHDGPNRAS